MKKLLHLIDTMLNGVTMYKLMSIGLSFLVVITILFGFTGVIGISGLSILFSALTLIIVCFVTNILLGIIWQAHTNAESYVITALILTLILPPATTIQGIFLIALGGIIAMVSKFLIAYHHKHLFNPAAFAALILGFGTILPAIWWVGSPALLVLVSIYGLLILRKLRRFQLFFSFAIASLVVALIVGLKNGQDVLRVLVVAFASSPLVFLGTVMLTEPETLPSSKWQQRIYGAIVGVILTSQFNFGFISATPEVALIIGNLYGFIVSSKYKIRMKLKEVTQLSAGVYEFNFTHTSKVRFRPGQYFEWTLPHQHTDLRGNRRTFSISSAPDSNEVRFVIRTSQRSSSFKKALLALKKGDSITAGQLSGEFILPKDTNKKLVFIAGGIGITPFLSMLENLVGAHQKRDIVLFYLVSSEADYLFQDLFKKARAYGVTVVPIVSSDTPTKTWSGLTGRLSKEIIEKHVPEYKSRRYYLSGPPGLVTAYRSLIRSAAISNKDIVSDYFSGY